MYRVYIVDFWKNGKLVSRFRSFEKIQRLLPEIQKGLLDSGI